MTTLKWKTFLIAPAMIAFIGSCKVDPKLLPENEAFTKAGLLADTVRITVNKSTQLMTTSLKLGVTYMKNTLDSWGDGPSITRGTNLLKGAVVYHNQHIFGFGADNPEPRPGVYDWTSLDTRVSLMTTTMQSTPVITFATAPTWMTDPTWAPGKYDDDTDWDKIEWAPLLSKEKDFAHLCAEVAKRYNNVRYFQVWNELKSMWDTVPGENHWDYERYTRLYNLVYDSVKKVRPDAIIGGPYIGIDSWIDPPFGAASSISDPAYGTLDQRCLDVVTYWLQHKHGGDFLCVDGGIDSNDEDATDIIGATKKFKDISTWLHSQTDLPVWWSEDYVGLNTDTTKQPAALGCMLVYHALGGDAVSLRWSPEQQEGDGNVSNFFSSTLVPNGGKPFNNYYVYKDFNTYFPAGTKLYTTTVSATSVMVMASQTKIMLINKTASLQKTKINSTLAVNLNPYQVKYVTLP